MEKRWVLKENGDRQLVKKLSADLGIDTVLAELLVQRGIDSYEGAKAFFRPELSQLHDPFLMIDMEKAIDRIIVAKQKKQKILVYGDYDVDGTTAVALVYTFLQEHGFEFLDFYIPDRYVEGYGISYKSIDYAFENDFSLVISLDCGIKAIEKIDYANNKGIDFIICDHHRPGDELPLACAVLDPKRNDSVYPFDELSGCGVGFKLIQAYSQRNGIPFSSVEKYLDLVAVSIASDIVPITGENRILAYYGLKLINNSPRPGIEAILKFANVTRQMEQPGTDNVFVRELTITDLVFLVGPRINAAGRIESGKNSVRLLISPDQQTAAAFASQINDFNTERRCLDATITQEALDMIAGNQQLLNAKSTVLFNPSWHKGVIGIVASRLTENYYRPTIILTQSNGLLTGSARSVKDFDIYDAIDACHDLLEHFGGHKYAAGLSLKPENLLPFCEKFESIVASSMQEHMLYPEIEIDNELNFDHVNLKMIRILRQFAPFGPGNMSPVFMTSGVCDTGYARIVGKNHIKLNLFQQTVRSDPFPAIAFGLGEHYNLIQEQVPMDICYHVEENEWNGQKNIQLNIKDIKFPND